MPNTIRIRTTPNGGDKYVKLKLDQDFDFIEILSLKISQEDTYRKFCSDYGAIVGRVIINNGFGVPNAKVSVFIPLDDVDKNDPLIKGLYPFEVITDKDNNGIRYNLLPKESETENECYTPVGTFPTKREVLDNDTVREVYCKYYKFTTTTNNAGDFMIFGVPLGTYTVHVDADISDIGVASQRPYDFISQGTPQKLFQSPTKFKGDKNLNKLIQVKTLNAGVNVQPFWGDTDNCEIGITRLDFDLNTNIVPAAIFMGSIFGDQHKHSINKRCRPRRQLGELCQQVAGPGSVNMIRKTLNGQIEEFSVDGGRVIDDDGTWAFQIPMNLDYMVTAEDGTLILSQDPNIGVPTRARVRFNIGMDETGGEGRIRTRARYLVPHNPANAAEIDYTFDSTTKDSSFKDLYWNKIYSISNFISRYQRNTVFDKIVPSKTRLMTGIKDVDSCAGDKTPFPYNRVNTDISPIFFIICLIMKVVIFIIYILNKILIPLINDVISIINTIVGAIVSVINSIIDIINGAITLLGGSKIKKINFTPINYIGCIYITCDDDNNKVYAPGCDKGGIDSGHAWTRTSPNPDYYENDSVGHSGPSNTGLDKCIAFEIAKALGLFQYDFYNDWVNGTLFGFLLKYKKKSKGREVFCEYECRGSGTFTPQDGVDGNHNGVGDNDCHDNILLDTSFRNSSPDMSNGSTPDGNGVDTQWTFPKTSINIREGLIKKVGDDFFYAATTHDNAYKLFATDVIDLGSVFDCDWQGIPKVQQFLIPTSYKLPPDTPEVNETTGDVETTGVISIGGNTEGLFFNINCLGLHVNNRQELNLRHISEFGVEIDEAIEDINTGNILVAADAILGTNDIDDDRGKWFRDVFIALNSGSTTPVSIGISNFSSDFNLTTIPDYDYTSAPTINGQDYVNFRGINNDSSYQQPKHSFYFYFGILPGKTALDKMNQRFFTSCIPITRDDIIIQSSTTTATGSTGSLTFAFIGGTGPFTYTVTGSIIGPPSSTYGPITGSGAGATLTGLSAGSYTVTGVDTLGNQVSTTITVAAQPPLSCSVVVSHNATTSISNDGALTINSIIGGTPPYTYKVETYSGALLYGPSIPISSLPLIIIPVPVDNINGHVVTIMDSAFNTCVTSGLTVSGPSALMVTAANTNILCYGDNSGSILLNVTGGQPPLIITTTGPVGYTSSSNNMSGLFAGTYTTTVIDANSVSTTLTNSLTQPVAPLAIINPVASELAKQCDPNFYYIPFYIDSSSPVPTGAIVSVQYSIDGLGYITSAMTYINSTTPLIIVEPLLSITANIKIKFSYNGCTSNEITIQKTSIELPPCALTLSLGSVPTNCGPKQSKFNVNLSHTVRAPYTISYSVGTLTGSLTVSSSPTLLTINSIPSSNYFPNQAAISLTVTDSVGCVSPTLLLTSPSMIPQVPAISLVCTVTTGAQITSGVNAGKYPHTVSGSGGIAPYTGTGVFYDTNTSFTTTITDTNGCSATATG